MKNGISFIVRDPESPIVEAINPDKLVLLGHSFGGGVGISALQGFCPFPNCPYTRLF